eukprot:scaffold4777_cov256-Chaetoceros_neogracile.AAC.13
MNVSVYLDRKKIIGKITKEVSAFVQHEEPVDLRMQSNGWIQFGPIPNKHLSASLRSYRKYMFGTTEDHHGSSWIMDYGPRIGPQSYKPV